MKSLVVGTNKKPGQWGFVYIYIIVIYGPLVCSKSYTVKARQFLKTATLMPHMSDNASESSYSKFISFQSHPV